MGFFSRKKGNKVLHIPTDETVIAGYHEGRPVHARVHDLTPEGEKEWEKRMKHAKKFNQNHIHIKGKGIQKI